ncbi:MAG: hypothetical protein ABSH04_03575, partial [Acidimicrobiales bacterium]
AAAIRGRQLGPRLSSTGTLSTGTGLCAGYSPAGSSPIRPGPYCSPSAPGRSWPDPLSACHVGLHPCYAKVGCSTFLLPPYRSDNDLPNRPVKKGLSLFSNITSLPML